MIIRLQILALLLILTLAWANLPSRMKIAADDEPGQRLVVTGRVFDADGKPLRVTLDAYQTDARGLYNPQWSFRREPRLRGRLLTAPDGSYEIDTIKPAPNPNRNTLANMHVRLRNQNANIDQEEEIRFEGAGPTICHAVADSSGMLKCTVDFRVRRNR
jgi:protocatechuate 3,4-dioxygenase beta subunit